MERITRHSHAAAGATSRIGMALLVSAALHLLLVVRVEVGGPRPDDSPPSIRARLDLASAPAAPSAPTMRTPVRTSPASVPAEDAPPAAIEQPVVSPQTEPGVSMEAPAAIVADPEAVPVPVDPVYYAAREFDVYPAPLEPLRAQAAWQIPGWVRVLVMVDETGSVTQAEVFDSDRAPLDEAALAAVRAARFSPARKDGRAVRSRVLIELVFEAQKQP